MSTFETSTLMNEVSAVINAAETPDAWFYEARVVVGDQYFMCYKVISIDLLRDYGVAYADKLIAEVSLPEGTFLHDILPYKQDLKLQLIRHRLNTFSKQVAGAPIEVKTYRATLIQTDSPETASNNPAAKVNKEAQNLLAIRTVSMQLQDIVMEQLRLIRMGTVVRQSTPLDAIQALVLAGSRSINVDQESMIKGITAIEADNQTVQDHLIFDHRNLMIDIPDIVQNEICGVYSSGLGFYLQNSMWYLWPLYNFDRFDRSAKTLTIILVPENKLNSIEKTYRVTANQVVVLITGGTKHFDDTEAKLLNEGNGLRFSDASRLIEGFGTVSGNRVVANRTHNGSEFVGVQRPSNLNHVVSVDSSANLYKQTSRLAARKGSKMLVNWQNSNPDLITPSMACQVIFERNGMPVTLRACIMGAHTYISSPDGGMSSRRHLTNTALSLFVDKDLPEFKAYMETSGDQYSVPL